MNELSPTGIHIDLRVGGVKFPSRIVGSGEPVLLTHGIPGDLRTLAPVADRLAPTYAAVTVSLFPDAALDRPDQPFGTGALTNDLAEIVRSLGRGPVHLVAWSYSAHAALALAARHPEFFRSLLVYEPGFPTFLRDSGACRLVQEDTMAAFGPVAQALEAGDEQEAVRRSIDGAASKAGWFDRQIASIRAVHLENARQLGLVFRQTPPVPLSGGDLRHIALPVTVARGERTRACYQILSDEAARLIPGARPVVVRAAGHLLPEQDPAGFAALVRRHIEVPSGAKFQG